MGFLLRSAENILNRYIHLMAYNHSVVSSDGNLNFWCPTTILDLIIDYILSAAAFHQSTDDRRKEQMQVR